LTKAKSWLLKYRSPPIVESSFPPPSPIYPLFTVIVENEGFSSNWIELISFINVETSFVNVLIFATVPIGANIACVGVLLVLLGTNDISVREDYFIRGDLSF
jgi:hypothetical protein